MMDTGSVDFALTKDPRLMRLISLHEGVKTKAYRDGSGTWTVGIGHNLEKNDLTKEAIEHIYFDDVGYVVSRLMGFDWFRHLDRVRQYAITDMAHQHGLSGFLMYDDMLAAMRRKDYREAAEHGRNSFWSRKHISRSNRVMRMLEFARYPDELTEMGEAPGL